MKPRRALVPAGQIVSILLLLGCLVAVLVLRSRCGPAVDTMFRALEAQPAAQDAAVRRTDGAVDKR